MTIDKIDECVNYLNTFIEYRKMFIAVLIELAYDENNETSGLTLHLPKYDLLIDQANTIIYILAGEREKLVKAQRVLAKQPPIS